MTLRFGTLSTFDDDALGTLDAVGIAKAIADKEVTAREVMEAAMDRAAKINPRLNAIVADCPVQARNKVGQLSPGVFSGVPTYVKDNHPFKGLPTRQGSLSIPIKYEIESSEFVRQYESTGVVVLGKSSMPEFGLTGTTEPLLGGATRNPWNPDYSAGGSSGGSAALVASGVVPIAHANDGGGSIRIPASCCGLVGLKPSRGRLLSTTSMETLPLRVTVEGVLTRTVRDTAAFFYGAEQHFTNSALPAIGEVRHPVKERLRVGVFVNKFDGSRCEHEVENATLSVAELCQNLGHFVEEIDCPFSPRLVDDFTHYWAFLGFAIYWFGKTSLGDEYLRKYTEPWTRALAKRATRQLWKLPLVLSRLRKFEAQYQQIFQKYDVLLSPTLGTTPPVLGHLGPDVEFETAYERLQNFAPFTLFQNAAGAPAISLPLARSQAGLPIGVQFASGVGRERMLLELAYELEQASPWDHLSMNL